MRIFLIFTLIFVFTTQVFAENFKVEPKVDKRIELISTVFRLAGANEYVADNLVDYTKEVDAYFSDFKNHKVVDLAKKARMISGVSYDAVASMATSIVIDNNGIRLQDDLKEESLEHRWKSKMAKKFVAALNDFYTKSDFEKFFSEHQSLYSKTEQSFNSILEKVDFKWFEDFYGEKPKGDYKLVLAMLNGYSNYGSTNQYQDGREEIYSIIGVSKMGEDGIPVFKSHVLETVIHEFNHSFCNKLMEANYEQMKDKSLELYKLVKNNMRRQAYGSALTMNREILVRACVIQYFKEKGLVSDIQPLVASQEARGFLWINQLLNKLDEYQQERVKYASLSDYMPVIVEDFNNLDVNKLWTKYNEGRAQIISLNIENGSKNVDPELDSLVVTFDVPMMINKNGISTGKKGKKYFPEFSSEKKAYWNLENKKRWVVFMNLEPGKTYSMSFPDVFFYSADGKTLKETYYLDFETRKE